MLKALAFGLLMLLQLIVTGICLSIGFKLGNVAYEQAQKEVDKRMKEATV